MAEKKGTFVWYELMTSDLDAATAFYRKVIGWNLQEFPGGKMRYVIGTAESGPVAGMMAIPPEAAASNMPPLWVGYIGVADVDLAAKQLLKAGGHVDRAPDDIPGVGRFAMVTDPQGGMFVLFTPVTAQRPDPANQMKPGRVGWHELTTTDWQKALAFYSGEFGWVKSQEMDMGAMGKYVLFKPEKDGNDIGGMMNSTQSPKPSWLFYFVVDDIDAAARRVADAKGKILNGPMEVPGGDWIIQATDPQGAMFALVGKRTGAKS